MTYEFRIADTFTDSLARLTGDEQKAVKTTAFDLQMNPAQPGHQFHRLEHGRDRNFWSVRVNTDIRLIVHRTDSSLLLCYVGHHDQAYSWAERRKIQVHPQTGAAQLVEVRETVREIVVPVYKPQDVPTAPKPLLFEDCADEELLGYGVPAEWLPDVRRSDEDSLLQLADRLPAEAAEALLELATGGQPRKPVPAAETVEPFEHPDAQRRFRTVSNLEELQRALESPWDKWTVFLHPEQRESVERSYNGPARISGSAGTGKTIVALHRAVYLARKYQDSRVLLATFSDTLAHALHTRLRRLIGNEPRLGERMDVSSLQAVGERLFRAHCGPLALAEPSFVQSAIREAGASVAGHKFSNSFLFAEWDQVVDAWNLTSWKSYRDVARLGRRTRLQEPQRQMLWSIYEKVCDALRLAGSTTHSQMFHALAETLAKTKAAPYDCCIVDEAQDVSVAQLRFLAAMGGDRPEALFFTGDLGQRIFQQPFSWKSLGVDIRGRARNLRINYRTSHQIRQQADRLLDPELTDVDGVLETRADTISVFNGPPPMVNLYETEAEEIEFVRRWISERLASGVLPHEIGVIVRSEEQIARARRAAEAAGQKVKVLDAQAETSTGVVSVGTMHMAKGLEFRAVAVMACDDEVIPSQARIEEVGDSADLQEVYDTERHLLYVACTRARDELLVTALRPGSEFLADIGLKSSG